MPTALWPASSADPSDLHHTKGLRCFRILLPPCDEDSAIQRHLDPCRGHTALWFHPAHRCVPLRTRSSQSWAGLPEGTQAYDRGDYATATNELRPLAEGLASAQFYLGVMYENGQG